MGWWSDVLADAIKRSKHNRDRGLLHALGRQAARIRREIRLPRRPRAMRRSSTIARSRRSSTPRPTTCISRPRAGGGSRQARLPRQADRQHGRGRPRDRASVREGRRRAGARLPAPPRKPFPLDQVRDRRGPLRQAGAGRSAISAVTGSDNIDLSSWRYQAAGMPGGVMLQIGIHYVDVLEFLMGPVKRVSAHARPARAAGRQPRRRQSDPRARERRALQPHARPTPRRPNIT